MKKILFLQNKENVYSGIWFVNKTLGESFFNNSYDVYITSIRRGDYIYKEDCCNKIKVSLINDKNKWDIVHLSDIEDSIKNKKIIKSFLLILKLIKDELLIKKDIYKTKKYIKKLKPDYILVCHYQILDFIPKSYLNKTLNVNHTSFKDVIRNRGARRTFLKFKDKVKFVWLTKSTMEHAIDYGIKNSTYIYNPVRFSCSKRNNVIDNKKIIVISRISSDKRIDLMINTMNSLFEDNKYVNWSFEIYGVGNLSDEMKKLIKSKQIKIMGKTDLVKETYQTASISLNTSPYEGFSLSILEANACGVPVVSLNFGESVYEEIIDNKTGFIADNLLDFKNKVKYLMDNPLKLDDMSKECFKFSKRFNQENIIKEWEKVFKEIDNKNI